MQYMEKPVTTAENILLIDTEYLNFLTHDIKSHFEPRIGRTLKDIDIVDHLLSFARCRTAQGRIGEIRFLHL